MPHSIINPAIYYFGTPVVLITTSSEDGTANIGPMSSAFWLGNRCILGLEASSQTTINLLRTKQCVLNLASDDMSASINAIAKTTGREDVPPSKVGRGYRHEKNKFEVGNLTQQPSELVEPPRILECPVQMEATMLAQYDVLGGFILLIEVEIQRTHILDELRLPGHANRVDPDAWKPMIMMFQNLYGLRDGKVVANSRLAEIDEEMYRFPTTAK